jgi:hypothetical protein
LSLNATGLYDEQQEQALTIINGGIQVMTVQRWLVYPLVLLMGLITSSVHAEKKFNDDFRIAIGGYNITQYDSTLSLTDSGVGAGVSIVPSDTFGWDSRQTVFRIDGSYRFTDEQSLTASWYSINNSNTKVLSQDIEWVDQNGNTIIIPTGATVKSGLSYDIYKVGYLWSFYHNEKVELSAGAGLHVTRVAIDISSDTTSSGVDARNVRTTVPLPVLSIGLKYHVTPRFLWYAKSQFFSLSYDDWRGNYTDAQLGMEYRLYDQFGVGVGVGSNSLKITQDTPDYQFTFENRISGILLYLAGYF